MTARAASRAGRGQRSQPVVRLGAALERTLESLLTNGTFAAQNCRIVPAFDTPPVPESTSVTLAFITHSSCGLHEMGSYHPESPARLDAIRDRLISAGLDGYLKHYEAPEATDELLARVHG